MAGRQALNCFLAHRAVNHVIEEQLPIAAFAELRIGMEDEDHLAAPVTQAFRHDVDRRHDITRGGDFRRAARGAKRVLHIDDDERGALRIERVEPAQPAAPCDNPVDDFLTDGHLMHGLQPFYGAMA